MKMTSKSVAAQTPVKLLLQTFLGLVIQGFPTGVEYPEVSKHRHPPKKGRIGHYIKRNADKMHA